MSLAVGGHTADMDDTPAERTGPQSRYGRAPMAASRYGRAPMAASRYGRAPMAASRYGRAPMAASRYGRAPMAASASRRVRAALATLTILLGLGVAVVAYQRFEGAEVEGETAAYEILDDRTAAVTISVTRKNPARTVVCIVRARSRDGAETGRREVVVRPSEARTVQITAKVTSYRPPFVGDVYGCGTDVPGYLTQPLG